MKRTFWVLALTVVFTVAATTCFAQKPKVKIPHNVTVVDSKGKIVGEISGNYTAVHISVLLELNDNLLWVPITRSGFGQGPLYFESTDCSGTPLIWVASDSLFVTPVVALPGNTVYVPDPHATVRPYNTLRSFRSGTSCISGNFGLDQAAPAIALIDLDTEFTPPFSVRTRP